MKINEFLEAISEALDCEKELTIDQKVEDIEEWDSLGILSLVSMFDEMGIPVELEKFEHIETIKQLVDLAEVSDE